jgi:hypothetical protein
LDRIPEWLRGLLELLEGQHKKERDFAARIESAFASVWAMIGWREFPDIKASRLAFGARYCS